MNADPDSLPALIPPPRTRCLCGTRNTVFVTAEFVLNGRVEYAGGRFCYEHLVHVLIPLPPGAALTEVRIYGWHVPDEQIKIAFSPQEDTHAA